MRSSMMMTIVLYSFRFRLVPQAFQRLHDDVERCMTRAIEIEEKIPLQDVTNFEEVRIRQTNWPISVTSQPSSFLGLQ